MSLLARFSQLPRHEQIAYGVSGKLSLVAFFAGLAWVFLGFNDQPPTGDANWHASELPPAEDTLGLYTLASERPRWFSEAGNLQPTQPLEDPAKSLEGKPESLRLTGLVTKGDIRYALFVPALPSATSPNKPSSVIQLKEGDKLVGDWEIIAVASSHVKIRQGEETRVIKMYQPGK